jgi:hypothetical protein
VAAKRAAAAIGCWHPLAANLAAGCQNIENTSNLKQNCQKIIPVCRIHLKNSQKHKLRSKINILIVLKNKKLLF